MNKKRKKKFILLGVLTGVLLSHSSIVGADEGLKGSLTLSGAWAVYPTAVVWAEAFQKIHPKVRIDISAGGAGKGAADAISGLVDIGMVSRDPDPAELAKDMEAVYILKDAVYPVVSEKNFFLKDLLKMGMKKQTLSDIYIAGTVASWDQIVRTGGNKPIHIFTRSDSSGAAACWAEFLGKKQEDLRGVGVYGDPGLLEAAKRDPVGIGYSNFGYVFTKEGPLLPGIKLVPIDTDNNGVADADEIYSNRAEAIAAIEAGRYPVTRKNYFFVRKNPNLLIKEFIRFVLSDEGAKIVHEVGASLPLLKTERAEVLKNLE